MQIWAPKVNQVSINEALQEKAWNHRFWHAYYNETDPKLRENLIETWEDPFPDKPKTVHGNFRDAYKTLYGDPIEEISDQS